MKQKRRRLDYVRWVRYLLLLAGLIFVGFRVIATIPSIVVERRISQMFARYPNAEVVYRGEIRDFWGPGAYSATVYYSPDPIDRVVTFYDRFYTLYDDGGAYGRYPLSSPARFGGFIDRSYQRTVVASGFFVVRPSEFCDAAASNLRCDFYPRKWQQGTHLVYKLVDLSSSDLFGALAHKNTEWVPPPPDLFTYAEGTLISVEYTLP